MQIVKNALAALAAAKARFHELVEPEKEIAARVEGVIHALAQELEAAFARIGALEQRLAAAEPKPAQPDAGAGATPTATDEATSPAAAQTAAPAANDAQP